MPLPRWAGPVAGVLTGAAAVFLGTALTFAEVSIEEGDLDCGRNARELLVADEPARAPARTDECRSTAEGEAVAGTVVTAAGIVLAVWSLRRPRDLAGADLELALMDRRGRWRPLRTTLAFVDIAAPTWVVVGLVTLVWLPIASMAAAVAIGAAVIGATAWLLRGPELRRTPDGLALRSWFRRVHAVPWSAIELVLPTTRAIVLVTHEEDRPTNLYGGVSKARRRLTERAAHDIARSVAIGQDRPEAAAAALTVLARPLGVPADDAPLWDDLSADGRRALRRDLVEAVVFLAVIGGASAAARALGW